MKGEVYIKISDGISDYGLVISFVLVNDLISLCSKVPFTTKGSIETDFVKQVVTPGGDVLSIGLLLKITFDTIDMSLETYTFLVNLLNSKVDVIFYDPIEKGILYGVQNFIPNLKITNLDDLETIHIAGQTANMDSLMFYKIYPTGVRLSYPVRGYIYNRVINQVNGIIN